MFLVSRGPGHHALDLASIACVCLVAYLGQARVAFDLGSSTECVLSAHAGQAAAACDLAVITCVLQVVERPGSTKLG